MVYNTDMPKIKRSQIKELWRWVSKHDGAVAASKAINCSYERIRLRLRGLQPMSRQLAEAIVKESPEIDIMKLLGYK